MKNNIFNMYNEDGTLNNNYMKGMLIKNNGVKKNSPIGIVVGFYISGDEETNKSHINRRFFTVRPFNSDKNTNWWYDKEDFSYNTNIKILGNEDICEEFDLVV